MNPSYAPHLLHTGAGTPTPSDRPAGKSGARPVH